MLGWTDTIMLSWDIADKRWPDTPYPRHCLLRAHHDDFETMAGVLEAVLQAQGPWRGRVIRVRGGYGVRAWRDKQQEGFCGWSMDKIIFAVSWECKSSVVFERLGRSWRPRERPLQSFFSFLLSMGAKRLAGVIRVDCLFLDSNRVIDIFVLLFSRHGRPQLTEYPKWRVVYFHMYLFIVPSQY